MQTVTYRNAWFHSARETLICQVMQAEIKMSELFVLGSDDRLIYRINAASTFTSPQLPTEVSGTCRDLWLSLESYTKFYQRQSQKEGIKKKTLLWWQSWVTCRAAQPWQLLTPSRRLVWFLERSRPQRAGTTLWVRSGERPVQHRKLLRYCQEWQADQRKIVF